MRRALFATTALALLIAMGLAAAPGGKNPAGWKQIDPPSGPGAMAPSLTVAGQEILLSWLEPLGPVKEPTGHRLQLARLTGERWSAPTTVTSGPGFFANWADFPAVAQAADGSLTAHWLAKMGEDSYAYGIFLARSTNRGATWSKIGMLHNDNVPSEHGFVSWIPEGKGLRAVWLDGRGMPKGEPMTLRSGIVGNAVPKSSEILDDRVCDCCQTDAALAEGGPIVAYRDRSPKEIRDIYVIRRTRSGWSQPVKIGNDGWKIPGCPVNGPAIAAAGKLVAVAWFTGAPPGPRVQVAFSSDGGATFGKPLLLDGAKPLGRVDVVLEGGDALVSWMSLVGENAVIRLRRVSAKGKIGPPVPVAATSAARGSGFPRVAVANGRLHLAWVEEGEKGRRVRLGNLPAGTLTP